MLNSVATKITCYYDERIHNQLNLQILRRKPAAMKAAVLLMVVVVAAVAVPIQWLELESAKTLHKSSRLGDVYSFCSTFSFCHTTPLCANNIVLLFSFCLAYR